MVERPFNHLVNDAHLAKRLVRNDEGLLCAARHGTESYRAGAASAIVIVTPEAACVSGRRGNRGCSPTISTIPSELMASSLGRVSSETWPSSFCRRLLKRVESLGRFQLGGRAGGELIGRLRHKVRICTRRGLLRDEGRPCLSVRRNRCQRDRNARALDDQATSRVE
jgi:hypothetical protein